MQGSRIGAEQKSERKSPQVGPAGAIWLIATHNPVLRIIRYCPRQLRANAPSLPVIASEAWQSHWLNPECQNPNNKQITDSKDQNAEHICFFHLYFGLDLAFELCHLSLRSSPSLTTACWSPTADYCLLPPVCYNLL